MVSFTIFTNQSSSFDHKSYLKKQYLHWMFLQWLALQVLVIIGNIDLIAISLLVTLNFIVVWCWWALFSATPVMMVFSCVCSGGP